MSHLRKILSQILVIGLVVMFLAGCSTSTASPAATALPVSPVPFTVPPPTLASQPTPVQPSQPTQSTSLFKLVQTVQITPDDQYLGGAFSRINYVPATDRFVVTFGGPLAQPLPGCGEKGFAYKEYSLDLQETAKSGIFSCDPFDAGSVMVDNTYYFAAMAKEGDQDGWHLLKIDATNWKILVDTFFPLTGSPQAGNADPMVAFVNGQIDISSQYNDNPTGVPPMDITAGAATHHHFFSPDFQLLDEKILSDTPHVVGSSMIFVDGTYYFVTANGFLGDLIVMKYDQNWKYLGMKALRQKAHWSTGLVFDGQRFYLAYLDTSQRSAPKSLPVWLNVHLAAFDRDWNLIDDVAVTSFAPEDNRQPGRPWVILHGNHLYVSYDMDTIDPTTHEEQLKWQAYVSVYELAAQAGQPLQPTSQPEQPAAPTGQPGTQIEKPTACNGNGLGSLGVLRSTDHGATWTSAGEACMQNTTVWAVDPTGFASNGRVVLYFVDFGHLNQATPQSIYRATSTDGLNFDSPQPVYTQDHTMVDPVVLPLADSSFRLYTPSEEENMISAWSRDGLAFTRQDGLQIEQGGMPAALLLPDGRVRIFLNGAKDGQPGIYSLISSDGLKFSMEDGMRIVPPSPNLIVDNAQPIHLANDGYLMLYQLHDVKNNDHPAPWTFTEIHLATSADGLNWAPNPAIIGYGGTSCIVEMPDGTLLIYYVNH
jgi:hypothetical protein